MSEPECQKCRGDINNEHSELFFNLTNNTCLIKNCVYETDTYCNKCQEGFVPSVNKESCVRKSIPGCSKYEFNGKNCLECEDSFAIIYNDVQSRIECVKNTIPGCQKPYNSLLNQTPYSDFVVTRTTE